MTIRLITFAIMLLANSCTSYNLDDKIRAANSGNSTSASGIAFSNILGGTYINGALQYTLSNLVKLSATVSYNGSTGGISIDTSTLPSFVSATISAAGVLQISTLSNSANLPTSLVPNNLNPTLRFFLSSGTSISVPLNLRPKRVFLTNESAMADFFTSGTGAFVPCSGQANGAPRANCTCALAAQAAGLPNSNKFKAYLSHGPFVGPTEVAKCSILNLMKFSPNTRLNIQVTNPGAGYLSSPTFGTTGGTCTPTPSYSTMLDMNLVIDVMVTNAATCTTMPTAPNFSGGGGAGATGFVETGACNVKPSDGGPWFRTDNALVARDAGFAPGNGGLFSTTLINAINKSQFGTTPATDKAWTGSYNTGSTSGNDCSGWTNAGSCTFGNALSSAANWADSSMQGFSAANTGLYCFETD